MVSIIFIMFTYSIIITILFLSLSVTTSFKKFEEIEYYDSKYGRLITYIVRIFFPIWFLISAFIVLIGAIKKAIRNSPCYIVYAIKRMTDYDRLLKLYRHNKNYIANNGTLSEKKIKQIRCYIALFIRQIRKNKLYEQKDLLQ